MNSERTRMPKQTNNSPTINEAVTEVRPQRSGSKSPDSRDILIAVSG